MRLPELIRWIDLCLLGDELVQDVEARDRRLVIVARYDGRQMLPDLLVCLLGCHVVPAVVTVRTHVLMSSCS